MYDPSKQTYIKIFYFIMLTIQGILLLNDTAVLKQLANSMEQIPA
jgi:hypothetical protein